ncbi:MAG: magnesium transporter CorA family protein [Streptococcaceae bacterium]|jgi:magnesium transporter|nr:magnesium transporter CorA family protein [Streptococcaceae bacterium]
MIQNYDLSSNCLVTKEEGTAFIEALTPTKSEIGALSDRFHFPFDYIGGILDDYENARFEVRPEGTHLLLLQYPSEPTRGEIETYPYALVDASSGPIILALNHEVDISQLYGRHYEEKRAKHQLIYHIISQMTKSFEAYLTDFRTLREKISHSITKSTKNDQLLAMIRMQSSLVYFEDALNNNCQVLKHYMDYLKEQGEDGFAERIFDLYLACDQARNESRMQAKLIENLRDLFSNIVANNLNIVMKIMTSATFVLGIPAIIVGFWGMNVPLPGQKITWMVWGILGFMALLSWYVAHWLKKRDLM